MIQTIKRKLSRKILTILTLALPLPMLAITYLSATFHIRDSIQHMTQIGNNLATVIYSGIKYPMSVGDQDAVSKQLLDIQIPEVEIFICDEKQVITYANRKNLIGMAVDDTIYDQRRWRQLQEDTTEKLVRQTAFEEKINHKNYLVIVQGITNQPECTHCHGTSQVILGSMVVRLGTDQTYSAIRAIISRNIMITIAGIFAITLAVYIMLAKLVASPIKKLADGMRDLPQRITEGNVGKIATTNREDEIGHLENTFMQMAEKLKEKRQLIERTNLELAAANKDLESFAYSVSHDLRAPLRNIEGFAKILLDECVGKLDEKCQHYLTRVRDGTLRMAQLIDDILNFSRTGRQELEIREINMPALLADVIIDFKEDIDKQGVKLTVHELPNTHGDANMLQNVFSNLLSNAIKYTRKIAKPEISIGFHNSLKAFYIEDNGIGFDMRHHDKIFQVFQRLQLPGEYEGTGIGLAIAHRIIQRHHGSIWAASEPGQGATFYIKLQSIS